MASFLGLDEFLGSNIGILSFPLSASQSLKDDNQPSYSLTKSNSVEVDEVNFFRKEVLLENK